MRICLRTVWGHLTKPGLLTLAGAAGVSVLLAGCSVGPDYVRPPTAAPDAYKENMGWKVAQPGDELPKGRWWEIYNDPQLNALEEQVNISNQNVAAAEANYRQALALIRIAWAAYFPTATGTVSWTRFRRSENLGGAARGTTSGGASGTGGTSGTGGGFGGAGGFTLSDYLLNFSATWEPDIWGKVRRSVESSRANAQASAATLEGVRLSAQATLAQNYFTLRALDEQKRLLDNTAVAYKKILDFTKNRYAVGVAAKNDVLLAETQLKTAQAQAIDLGVQRAQLEHAMAVLLGKPAANFSVAAAKITMGVPPIPAGVPSELLERRPDIATAERDMAAANAKIGVAVAAYFPNVTLSASGGFEASNPAKWFLWPSRFWSLGAAAAETLFDAGLRGAQTDQARAAYEGTVATYRQTVLTGFQEVEDNLAALRILEEEARVQKEAVKASGQSLEISTNQYKAGTINSIDLLVVETVALNNQRTEITILGNRMTASVLLVKALGGGWKASDLPSVATRTLDSRAKAPKPSQGDDPKRPATPPEPGDLPAGRGPAPRLP
jgi:NodT family efflux transporter outer membrane factor (OMF) lipoprotein